MAVKLPQHELPHDLNTVCLGPWKVRGFLSRNTGLANVLLKGAVRSRDPSIVGAVIQFVHCTRPQQVPPLLEHVPTIV